VRKNNHLDPSALESVENGRRRRRGRLAKGRFLAQKKFCIGARPDMALERPWTRWTFWKEHTPRGIDAVIGFERSVASDG